MNSEAMANEMFTDGLRLYINAERNTYEWYLGHYKVATKSVREVWGINAYQLAQFYDWLLTNETELITWV